MDKIQFKEIICNTSCYGLIWKGNYIDSKSKKSREVVIKMVVVDSGVHYDHRKNKYYNKTDQEKKIPKIYSQKDKIPFVHNEFKSKRTMSQKQLQAEITGFRTLHSHNLAPEIYDVFVIKDYPIHYAFIVMEKADAALKDIFMNRAITESEKQIVYSAINKMHENFVHYDMKPSNIGIFLRDNEIYKAFFLDCGKVTKKKDLNEKAFKDGILHDWKTYHKHRIMNSENV